MSYHKTSLADRIDWLLIIMYLALTIIGVLCIYSVEHRDTDIGFFIKNKNYVQQFIWFSISIVVGFVIIMMDSKFITTIPFLSYVVGFFFLLLTLTPLGKAVKGSSSFLNLGFFTFQPGETMKLFTALSIAKFLTLQEVNFQTLKHRLMCAGIALVPLVYIMLFQNETGLALVYLSFFIAMYREGLPREIIIVGFSVLILTLATLLINKNILFVLFTVLAILFLYTQRKQLRKRREILILVGAVWFIAVLFSQVLVPFAFKKVLKGYQVQRIYTMLGQEVPDEYTREGVDNKKQNAADYNVSQSKIAIASGGFIGKGFLNGAQTQYNWVPEQRTDFIFCTVGEQFGFLGSSILILIYMSFLLRIVKVAERQRSAFSRIYAYCVAGILFFHLVINVGMTIGLAPVIGIPLPLLSYGGTSLLTFTIMIFILIRLDMDRQMVLR
ncbi:MAG: rod shape-determining protein RodA [Chitinophagaceae bacterium]|nr:rod shape-determining protein RodA [Chitinophagaceae bacterium]